MNVRIARHSLSEASADLVAVAVRDGKEASGAVSSLPKAQHDAAARRVKKAAFKGKAGSSLLVQGEKHDLLLVGIGDGKSAENWRKAGAAVRSLRPENWKK